MEFRLLGPVEVWVDGERLPLNSAKVRCLLAALLLEQGRVIAAGRLVDLLWPDDPPETARALIQTYVSNLRQTLSKHDIQDVVVTRSPGYVMRIPPGTLDRDVFEQLVAEGKYDAALALWRGPALANLDNSRFAGIAAAMEERRLAVVSERIAAELNLGRDRALIPELTVLAEEYPGNEKLRGQLMLALHRVGRQADALAAYRRCREWLIEETGLEPGQELSNLHKAILRDEVQPITSAAVPAQLPLVPHDFTGRGAQLDSFARALLSASDRPVVQVVAGPGGVGKSAFAAYVAHRVAEHFPDGQLYAEMHGMTDTPAVPGEILGRFLRALGLVAASIPDDPQERAALFRSTLTGKRVLILLDDARSEQQARPLLPASPGCAVVITSRDRLGGLTGARLTELDLLSDEESRELLGLIAGVDRVAAEPTAARDIVVHCGRLPLAIRIAGARLATRRQWPLALLASRLADERQRLDELSTADLEVRSTIALGYRGLDELTRAALRRLGYLGTPVISADVVSWLLDLSESAAERLLERLVDMQLVDISSVSPLGHVHYRIHDLVRLYGHERAESEEDPAVLLAAVARVAGSWLTVVNRIAATLPSGEMHWQHESSRAAAVEQVILDRVLADAQGWFDMTQTSLVVGIERAADLGLHEVTLQFASARFTAAWGGSNRFEVRERVIAAALGATRRARDRRGEAILQAEMGQLRYDQDRYAESRQHLHEALSVFQEIGDLPSEANTLADLGAACRETGHLTEALYFLDRATILCRQSNDNEGLGYTRRLAGSVRLELGQYAEAGTDLSEALTAYQKMGSGRGEATTLRTLALFHRARGEFELAHDVLERISGVFLGMGDRLMEAYVQRAMGKTKVRLGQYAEALGLIEESLATSRSLNDRWGEGCSLRTLGDLHLRAGRLDAAEAAFSHSVEVWDALGLPLMRARTERDLSTLHEQRGDSFAAKQLLDRALTVFHDFGTREYQELQDL